MFHRVFTSIIFVALSLLSMNSAASLIVNGGFELDAPELQVGGRGASSWVLYSDIPGWDANRNVELWRDGFLGVDARAGDRLLELNAHGGDNSEAFAIAQSFGTQEGGLYSLAFSARARNSASETFQVSVGDFTAVIEDHTTAGWMDFNFTFTALADVSHLIFESLDGRNDTTGNLLDEVAVNSLGGFFTTGNEDTPEVPAPAAIWLLLPLGLVAIRRRLA